MYHLRHSQNVHREEDGAVQFWRIKENLQNQFPHSLHFSDSKWKVCLAGGGNERRFQYCTDSSGKMCISELFKDIQDAILLILRYRTMWSFSATSPSTYVGCAFNLHSIISSGLIPVGQSVSKRQTERAWPQQFVIGNDEAELELSVESRSFVNRVNGQVRKRQKRISNVTEIERNIL